MMETDNMLKTTHQQHCALALVLVKGITHINDIVAKLRDSVAAGEGLSLEETQDLASELSDETTRPFAQAFRVLASKSDDQHIKRRGRLVEGLKGQDEVLANAIKEVPLGHKGFFVQDILDIVKEANNRASIKSMMKEAHPPRSSHHNRDNRSHPYTRPNQHRGYQGGSRGADRADRGHPGNKVHSRPFHGGRPGQSERGHQQGSHRGKVHSFKGSRKQDTAE